jgi:2-polyprenyl-6-methoxyphenol hydroxylase-like FAD-dependent oxidoreductase
MEIAIIGAGIGGLTLALELHAAGIRCRVYEAVATMAPLGVGINVLPHATSVLASLGLEETLARTGLTTKESIFFNRFGQFIHSEPAGRSAGFEFPQFSIHRGDLQQVLLDAVRERLGQDAVRFGHRCRGFEETESGVTVFFQTSDGPVAIETAAVIACDGIHSAIRRQLYPDEGEPVYSGINMWRGVAAWEPFLSGASMVRAGWLSTGKMVIYPIRDAIDAEGRQLVNWVAEIETPHHLSRDWNRRGRLDDFIGAFEDWHFDWLDVPALIRASETVLEYPMVDQDPLPRWTFGRVTLLGDAAHPMVPRGSNGAGQAILDAARMRTALEATDDPGEAFLAYEEDRRPATAQVVRMNRTAPPDILLKEVVDRTGDRPFESIDEVLSAAEIEAISERYRTVAGLRKK